MDPHSHMIGFVLLILACLCAVSDAQPVTCYTGPDTISPCTTNCEVQSSLIGGVRTFTFSCVPACAPGTEVAIDGTTDGVHCCATTNCNILARSSQTFFCHTSPTSTNALACASGICSITSGTSAVSGVKTYSYGCVSNLCGGTSCPAASAVFTRSLTDGIHYCFTSMCNALAYTSLITCNTEGGGLNPCAPTQSYCSLAVSTMTGVRSFTYRCNTARCDVLSTLTNGLTVSVDGNYCCMTSGCNYIGVSRIFSSATRSARTLCGDSSLLVAVASSAALLLWSGSTHI